MELVTFLWGIISSLPVSTAILVEFAIIVVGGFYFKKRVDAMQLSIDRLTKDIEETKGTYAKVTELALVRNEMMNLSQQMTTGFQAINNQLTTISAAVISAANK